MATHSSILAQRIPWTEEPVVYSPWSHKESDTGMLELVLRMRTNKAHLFTLWAALYGVTLSWTRLKRLGSSSSCLLSWSLVEMGHERCVYTTEIDKHYRLGGSVVKNLPSMQEPQEMHV